jgi:hypothetical protein
VKKLGKELVYMEISEKIKSERGMQELETAEVGSDILLGVFFLLLWFGFGLTGRESRELERTKMIA